MQYIFPESQRMQDVFVLTMMIVTQSSATPSGRDCKREFVLILLRVKISLQVENHFFYWLLIEGQKGVIVTNGV